MSDAEKNPNEKVNFLGRQLTRAEMEPYIKFYEADQKLTTDDRKVMAAELNWITNSTQLWGMFDSSLAFFAPTFYRRFSRAKKTQVVETWRNMPIRQFIHRPFLSMAIGTVTYFFSLVYHAKSLLDYQVNLTTREIAEGTNQEEIAGKKRRLDVWKSMFPSQISLYYLYYLKSSQEPSIILKDPREMAANPHEVHYIPPAENRHLPFERPEPEREDPHWAKIRAANGFAAADKHTEEPEKEDEPLGFDPEPESDEPETSTSSNPASAWERIRRGK